MVSRIKDKYNFKTDAYYSGEDADEYYEYCGNEAPGNDHCPGTIQHLGTKQGGATACYNNTSMDYAATEKMEKGQVKSIASLDVCVPLFDGWRLIDFFLTYT